MTYFAEDAVYETLEGYHVRGLLAIRAAFEPQFRGVFGRIQFLTQDMLVDEAAGKVVLPWRCQHDLSQTWGVTGREKLKQLFLRTGFGQAFHREGLDVLHFAQGRLRRKQTYSGRSCPSSAGAAPERGVH
jgi:SnoaL-like protein